MRTLGRFLRSDQLVRTAAFCDSCGQVCTAEHRAASRIDQDRAAALRNGLPR
jgi:hypothetical protein